MQYGKPVDVVVYEMKNARHFNFFSFQHGRDRILQLHGASRSHVGGSDFNGAERTSTARSDTTRRGSGAKSSKAATWQGLGVAVDRVIARCINKLENSIVFNSLP